MNKSTIAESVMDQINGKHVCMKSRASIIVGSVALGVGLALLAGVTVVVVSLILYQLRVFGAFGFLWFGVVGIAPFLHTLPWMWIGISVALVVAGFYILKQYDFSYKTGYRSILGIFCVSVFGLAMIVDKIGLHERISSQPTLQRMYTVSVQNPHWMMGEVIIASPSGIVVMTPTHQQYSVHYSVTTKLPTGANFKPGNKIQTIGSFAEDLFEAEGIVFSVK